MQTRLASAIERHRRGLVGEAEMEYRRILADHPDFAPAHNALGIALAQQGRPAEAAAAFQRACALQPDYAAAHGNLGAALLGQGRRDAARQAFAAALALDEGLAEAHYNLASLDQQDGALDQAIAGYDRAVALDPRHSGAYNNRGMSLRAAGRLDEALDSYARAAALAPADPLIRYGQAQALLEAGDFAQGWPEHEARFAAGIAAARHADLPRWQGEDLSGKTVLVWAEQGLGDSIQFCRYLPLLAARGATVVFEVQEPLARLCRSLPGIEVVGRGAPLPRADFQVPLMSLPLRLHPTPFAPDTPYLAPITADAARWSELLGPRSCRRVALVWAGSPTHRDDANRSLPPERLGALDGVAGIEWFSLQVGPAAPGLARSGLGRVRDLSGQLGDLADTAAVLSRMDLLITVDTAVLHLAGAVGITAWGLLPFAPDWRWLRDRPDSPWYPSLRLFRQSRRRDWDSVMARVGEAIVSLG